MDERSRALRFLSRARARWAFVRAVHGGLTALFVMAVVALIAGLAYRFAPFPTPIPWLLGAAGSVLLCGILLGALFPRRTALQVAAEIDARAGWKERLSSLIALPALGDSMSLALRDDVNARLDRAAVSRLFPLTAPRQLKWAPLALVLFAGTFLIPSLDLFGHDKQREEEAKEKEKIRKIAEKVEKSRTEAEKKKITPSMEQAVKAQELMDRMLKRFEELPPDRKQAMAEVSALSDEIKQMRKELETAQEIAQRLQKAAEEAKADTGEIGKKLAEGKLHEAAQELAKMRNRMNEDKMSEEERKKTAEQLQKIAQQIEEAKDKAQKEKNDKLASELGQMKESMDKAAQGLRENDEGDLGDLQSQLDQLESKMNESEMLEGMMDQLEQMQDDLAKGQGECPSCGEKQSGLGQQSQQGKCGS